MGVIDVEVTAIVVAAGRVYTPSDTRAAFESETILIVVVVGEKTERPLNTCGTNFTIQSLYFNC